MMMITTTTTTWRWRRRQQQQHDDDNNNNMTMTTTTKNDDDDNNNNMTLMTTTTTTTTWRWWRRQQQLQQQQHDDDDDDNNNNMTMTTTTTTTTYPISWYVPTSCTLSWFPVTSKIYTYDSQLYIYSQITYRNWASHLKSDSEWTLLFTKSSTTSFACTSSTINAPRVSRDCLDSWPCTSATRSCNCTCNTQHNELHYIPVTAANGTHQAHIFNSTVTLSCLRWWIASISPQSNGFNCRTLHVEFVVDKVALRQVFFIVIKTTPCPHHSTYAPYSFTHSPITNNI